MKIKIKIKIFSFCDNIIFHTQIAWALVKCASLFNNWNASPFDSDCLRDNQKYADGS